MNLLRLALMGHDIDDGWYGVDLDSTLAKYELGDGIETIGEPIAKMVEFVKQLLEEGKYVKIMTARVSGEEEQVIRQRSMIADWTEEHIGRRLESTCQKDRAMILLYDDRARQVVENEGTIIEA